MKIVMTVASLMIALSGSHADARATEGQSVRVSTQHGDTVTIYLEPNSPSTPSEVVAHAIAERHDPDLLYKQTCVTDCDDDP